METKNYVISEHGTADFIGDRQIFCPKCNNAWVTRIPEESEDDGYRMQCFKCKKIWIEKN